MAKNSANAHAYAGSGYGVWTAPYGTTGPTNLTVPVPSFYEVGLLDDGGIGEVHNLNDNFVYDMSGGLVRDIRNQEQRQFTFSALERNAVTFGLLYNGSTVTTSGGTAEVQTAAFTGTGTAGTFNLTLPGYGTASALAYNIATAALQTALNTAFATSGITVTGTAGTTYTVTFPTSLGNVPQMTAVNNITGVTAINVTTGTPGVAATNTRPVGAGTGLNRRAWVVDTVDGTMQQRFVINNGEAVQTGTVNYTGSGLAVYQFTLNCYLDTNNLYYTIVDSDPAMVGSFA